MAAPARGPIAVSTTSQVVCAVGLGAGIVAAYALLAVTPQLLEHHPVTLEAASGGVSSLVTGGAYARVGREPLPLVLLAPLATVGLYDIWWWWAGRIWGNALVDRLVAGSPRLRRRTASLEGLVRRRGALVPAVSYLLPVPNSVVQVICGMSGMRWWVFVLGDVLGLLVWEGALVGLGWTVGRRAVGAVHAVSHYALFVTVAIVGVVVVVSVLRARRAIRGPGGAGS